MSSILPVPSTRFAKQPLSIAIGIFTLGLCLNLNVQAEEAALEEVIITSLKRPQSLQDAPVSVSVIKGDTLEEMGVENLEDLTRFVPNIHFTETGISTQMRIRGIGSDNSQGFEQSVSVFVDGIQHSRAQLFRAPMFDMERVEVMRGPQSTLFGKNSVAGALDLITAKPTSTFEGKISASYESEYGTNEASGYVSGPLTDTLNGRIALRSYNDPGYIVNNFTGEDETDQEELSFRGSLDWKASDNLKVLFVAEHDTFDTEGRAIEITQDISAAPGILPTYSQVLANPAFNDDTNPGPTFNDSGLNFVRDGGGPTAHEYSDNVINSQTLRLDYEMNDYVITSLTGILGFDYTENCDCDFTPADIFSLSLKEEYDQISQEIRIASPSGETVEWIAGVFYQSYEQNFADVFNILPTSLLPKALIRKENGRIDDDDDIADEDKAAAQAQAQAAILTLAGAGITREFEQKSNAWAVFGEATWNITSDFNITLGARFTEEKKEATKTLNSVDITNGNTPLTGLKGGTAATLFKGVFAVDTEQLKILGLPSGHNLDSSRDESAFTPSLTLAYHINDDIMTYARASKGFKAGGFDPRSNNTAHFEFEEEEVVAMELGSKMSLAEGKGELNIALFHMGYDNLQISQFDGGIGFNIGNAKDTVVQGLELDGRWQLNKHFTTSFGFAYLDFEYKDFKNGNCHVGQSADSIDPETGANMCDYTGKRGVYTPEFTINGSIEYTRPLNDTVDFVTNADMQWIDEQMVHVNLDPNGLSDAHTMLALRVGIEAEQWQLALLGQNLLNEEVISYSGNAPLAETIIGSNTFYSFVGRPRTVAVTGSYTF